MNWDGGVELGMPSGPDRENLRWRVSEGGVKMSGGTREKPQSAYSREGGRKRARGVHLKACEGLLF